MPTTYAHYKLGQAVLAQAPRNTLQVIEAYPQLFSIGLHGPDILFYHNPLVSNPVMRLGYDMHDRPGSDFFAHAKEVLKAHSGRKDYLSYVYGVLCHFALDVSCHGYVGEKEADSGVTHAEIESEFDRELLIRDALNPVRTPLARHIIASMENAEVIKDFYPDVSAKELKNALSGMLFYHRLLLSPSKLKRGILFSILKLTGHYPKMRGLFINYEANSLCIDSNQRLLQLFDEGKELALKLMESFLKYVYEDAPLEPIYQFNFDGKEITADEV